MPSAAARSTRAVLVDLDDTLFDHRHATRSALVELRQVERALALWSAAELEARHAAILELLHADVLAGRRSIEDARHERFARLLDTAGVERSESRIAAAAACYRVSYERAWCAVPGAVELLASLAGGGLPVVVVTNNGVAEQRRKMARCGLDLHTTALVTSEEVGVSKPARRIFDVALEAAGTSAGEAVMLGDAWTTDIVGALGAGIRPVWLNRRGLQSPDPTVAELSTLLPTDLAKRAVVQA